MGDATSSEFPDCMIFLSDRNWSKITWIRLYFAKTKETGRKHSISRKENSQLQSEIKELKKNQEPYAETAENQKVLKEGALAEVKNLQEQNENLKKEIEILKQSADHPKRLQDGVMHELKKTEDKLHDLQAENEALANQLQEELWRRKHSQIWRTVPWLKSTD